jgi:sugar/nucleoside kinase (ribokinase family)
MTSDEKSIDLYGFGIAAVDDLIEIEGHPEPGTKIPVLARQRQGGGLCTTALVAAARLGLRCRYDGLLGRNELSDFVREGLRREGIALEEEVRYPDAEPYHSAIVIDRGSGERTILSYGGKVVAPGPEDVHEERIRASRALFVDHLGPAGVKRACDVARNCGVPVIADIERINDEIAALLPRIDHLILPLALARQYTGAESPEQVVLGLAGAERACTAVTDGERGCWFSEGDGGEVRHMPAFSVNVVDTTGCGDVFHGAYAAGVVWGWSVEQSIRFASAAAALKATKPGAQLGAPNRVAVERFLEVTGSA